MAKVKSLSGGERNRLLLARLFAKPANFLVLDEPTNDLDIETLDLLEELLQGYPGTVMVASHDRTFLDNVATQVFVFEGAGKVREFAGGYSDWQMQLANMAVVAAKVSAPAKPQVASKNAPQVKTKKLSSNEQKELESLPKKIDALGVESENIQKALANPATYQDPKEAAKVKTLQARLIEIEKETNAAMTRWEQLEAVRER
jgi:ABC transport system ATP-binding/permease protein